MDEGKSNVVVNLEDVAEQEYVSGAHWGHAFKPLTPAMEEAGRALGVNLSRLPPGRAACPFHSHQVGDEVFYILSGRGVLRLGEELVPLRPGDCISRPAGTGRAHQIANPYDQDLIYLAIGPNDPNEVCLYPDSGKILVRNQKQVGRLEACDYMDGEEDRPIILDLIERSGASLD